jgi:hypothetical protein
MTKLLNCRTYKLHWKSPTGTVTLVITHTKTFFERAHVVAIEVPPDTPFPLDTLSYLVTDAEMERFGGANGFVQSLIAAAENTPSWRKHAIRAAQGDLFAAPREPDPRARPKPRRRRLTLPAPER